MTATAQNYRNKNENRLKENTSEKEETIN